MYTVLVMFLSSGNWRICFFLFGSFLEPKDFTEITTKVIPSLNQVIRPCSFFGFFFFCTKRVFYAGFFWALVCILLLFSYIYLFVCQFRPLAGYFNFSVMEKQTVTDSIHGTTSSWSNDCFMHLHTIEVFTSKSCKNWWMNIQY